MSAQERYEYLEQYFPEIPQRASLTQLSPYLGVVRETIAASRAGDNGTSFVTIVGIIDEP